MSTPVSGSDPQGANKGRARAATARWRLDPRLRYAAALAVMALLLVGGVYLFLGRDDLPPPRQVREIVVNIVPPPPPPPPPPPEQKMIEQPKMAEPDFKEEKPVEEPKDEPVKDAKNDQPPAPLSLDAKPVGPGDLFNLGGKPGGSPYGGGGGGGGSYGGMVAAQVQDALRANKKTRNAAFRGEIRLWADETGRVTRVVVATGNAELDADVRDALNGLVLHSPPPKDKPLPLVTRVTQNRPS